MLLFNSRSFAWSLGKYGVTLLTLTEVPLDAATALHEAVLPRWHWSVYDTDGFGNPSVQVEPPEYSFEPFTGISRVNPARAWLIAILKALIAEEDT